MRETIEITIITILFVLLCCQTIDKKEKIDKLNQEVRDKESVIETLNELVMDLTYELEDYHSLSEEEKQ